MEHKRAGQCVYLTHFKSSCSSAPSPSEIVFFLFPPSSSVTNLWGAARLLFGLVVAVPSSSLSFSSFSSLPTKFVAALFCPLVVLCDRLPLFCCSVLSSFVGVPRFPRLRGTDVDDCSKQLAMLTLILMNVSDNRQC